MIWDKKYLDFENYNFSNLYFIYLVHLQSHIYEFDSRVGLLKMQCECVSSNKSCCALNERFIGYWLLFLKKILF